METVSREVKGAGSKDKLVPEGWVVSARHGVLVEDGRGLCFEAMLAMTATLWMSARIKTSTWPSA